MSPLKVLSRGYAIVSDNNGCVVSSVDKINPGERVGVRFSDGIANMCVLDIHESVSK